MRKEKLAIFGTKKETQYLCQQIQKNIPVEVNVFVDNDTKKHGMYISNVPVVSFAEFQQMYGSDVNAVIVAPRGTYSRWEIYRQLRDNSINKLNWAER